MESKNGLKNKRGDKASSILYISLAAVLVAGAVLCGVLTATLGDKTTDEPVDNIPNDVPTGGVEDPSLKLPNFVSPAVGLVTKGHDMDTLVYFSTTDDWRVHCGIDISTAMGDGVMAAADGVVKEIVEDPLYGTTVALTHNGGAVTYYGNLSSELAEGIVVGAEVKQGDLIGCVGESAMLELVDEPHLHFEMTVGGDYVDPMDFISESSKSTDLSQDTAFEG